MIPLAVQVGEYQVCWPIVLVVLGLSTGSLSLRAGAESWLVGGGEGGGERHEAGSSGTAADCSGLGWVNQDSTWPLAPGGRSRKSQVEASESALDSESDRDSVDRLGGHWQAPGESG
jgi:hypothetical protein